MPLIINVRQLKGQPLRLRGELPARELEIEGLDELIQADGPLRHDLQIEFQSRGLLLQGRIALPLRCECARCLRVFSTLLELDAYCRLLAWEGEDAVQVVNDYVDLTPYVREDIVLALPQRPLCRPECAGLEGIGIGNHKSAEPRHPAEGESSVWSKLNELDL